VEENNGEYTLDEIVGGLVPEGKDNLKAKIYSYLNAQVITAEEEYEEEYSDGDIQEYTEDYMEDVKDSVEKVEDFVGIMDTVTKEILNNNFLTEDQLKELGDTVGKQISNKKGLEDEVVASVNTVLNNVFADCSIEDFKEAIKDVSFAAEFSKAIHAAISGVSKRFSAPKISIKPDGTIDLDYEDSGEESISDEGAADENPFPESNSKPAKDFAPSELEKRTDEMATGDSADTTGEEITPSDSGETPAPGESAGELSKLEKTFNKYNK
jgi:hypothetical protein